MRVHVVQTGTTVGSETLMRAASRSDALRAIITPTPFEFPTSVYVLEHDEGHIVIDTGLTSRFRRGTRFLRRLVDVGEISPEQEIGPQMRQVGLRPENVRLVILTHLDIDHAGGVEHFPNADIIVNRGELDYANTFVGKQRYQPKLWPASFRPKVFDLRDERFGPFPQSLPVTNKGDVTLVPIPGHSIAQTGVVVRTDGPTLLFGADHTLRQDWFKEDVASGRLVMAGIFFPEAAIESTKRIEEFVRSTPTVLVPAHDADAAHNLARREPLQLSP